MRPQIILVSPAVQEANNGNWHTAHRWAQFLSGHADVTVVAQWSAPRGCSALLRKPQLMIALHANRSAASIQAWAQACPDKALIVVLTGTDLYRDIQTNSSAQKSLALASHLVLLQDAGLAALPQAWHHKAQVIYQSAPALVPAVKSVRRFRALMVGHLREEKDPLTFMQAALWSQAADVFFDQIGSALSPEFALAAQSTATQITRYQWLGEMPRAATRQRIKRAHVLVNCSRMEGGAHVILEAVQSGTPVLASRISGNIGMLGTDYQGFFEQGNAQQLTDLVHRCAAEPDFLAALQAQCGQRAQLFDPHREKQLVINLAESALSYLKDPT